MANRARVVVSGTMQGLFQIIVCACPGVDKIMPTPRLNLIGCGRVGQTLALLWHAAGLVEIVGLHSRSRSSAEAAQQLVGAGRVFDSMADLPPAELWLITSPDTAIASVAQQLAAHLPAQSKTAQPSSTQQGPQPVQALPHSTATPIALHCSGFTASDALAPLQALGWAVASAHPVRSFADPASAAERFKGTPVALEGDARACELARRLFGTSGGQCFAIAREAKPLYHAASVFANNFTTVLQGIAQDLWQHCGISPEMTRQLDIALLQSTLDNLKTRSPAEALTGPAARGDTAVVQAQGQAVAQWDAKAGEAYALLSELAQRLKAKQTRHD
jgi:predicted short-subunit dehydrogenase-like oxidoreductase (DUF2520 family)